MEDLKIGFRRYDFADKVYNGLSSAREDTMLSKEIGASNISRDLKKIINNPDYSDVVFLCNDGVRVHALIPFLAVRSDFFHSMFKKEMVESRLSEIALSEISSAQLLPVMEYLCTGELRDHTPKDSTQAFNILIAANCFSLKDLTALAMEPPLDAPLREAKQDLTAAAKFLSIVVDFMAVHGKAVAIIAEELVRIMLFSSLEPEQLRNLSRDAFLYYLEASKSTDSEPNFLTDLEFMRFRNIVLWCVCKEFASKESIAMQTDWPELCCTIKLLEKSTRKSRLSRKKRWDEDGVPPAPKRRRMSQQLECLTNEESDTYRKMKEQLRLSARQFLPMVQLRRISPETIKNIVEPMDILPPSDIKEAFEFHAALQLSFKTDEDNLGWSVCCGSTDKQHKVYESESRSGMKRVARGGSYGGWVDQYKRGSLLKRVGSNPDGRGSYALYNVVLNHHASHKIYIWEIVIEEVCKDFIEIGLYTGLNLNLCSCIHESLWWEENSLVLRLNPDGMEIKRKSDCILSWETLYNDKIYYGKDCSGLVYGRDYAHKQSKIKVCLDMVKRECSFVIGGKDFGPALTDLSSCTYRPAVSLGNGRKGAVSNHVPYFCMIISNNYFIAKILNLFFKRDLEWILPKDEGTTMFWCNLFVVVYRSAVVLDRFANRKLRLSRMTLYQIF